jgi:phytol kinase
MNTQWIAVTIVVGSMVAMLAVLEMLRRRVGIRGEITRKAAHIGLGLATLSFPFLFDDVGPVVAIGAVIVASLAAIRWIPTLAALTGDVLHGVERRSGGELYFPLAATGLFVATKGDPVLFGVPILTLTVADAVAAVVGVHYGRIRYETGEAPKSLEGSLAFFTAAFLTTHLPLLLFTSTGRLESVLIGMTFGILVMLVEAVSLRGTDNLLIPFGGAFLLAELLHRGIPELVTALAVTVFLLTLVLVLRTRRTLSDTAVLAAALFGFVSWAVGGWRWLVPPVVFFLSYTILWPRQRLVRERPHDVVATAAVVFSPLVWAVLAFILARPEYYYPYTIAVAANLCFFGITWLRTARPQMHPLRRVAWSGAVAWIAIVPVSALAAGVGADAIALAAAGALWLVAGGLAFTWAVPPHPGTSGPPYPWLRQAALGLAASAPALALLPLPSR